MRSNASSDKKTIKGVRNIIMKKVYKTIEIEKID